ncbi:hypothetical protein BKA93DRAFT_177888 [Sparassis latifolia]
MSSPTDHKDRRVRSLLDPTHYDILYSLPDDHPLAVALRTYVLALSLALGPALLPFVTSPKARINGLARLKNVLKREFAFAGFAFAMTVGVGCGAAIRHVWNTACEPSDVNIRCEDTNLALCLAKVRRWLSSVKYVHRTFISNFISSALAITLLHSRRPNYRPTVERAEIPLLPHISESSALHKSLSLGPRPPPTLDLTLLILVRALDFIVQATLGRIARFDELDPKRTPEQKEKRRRLLHSRLDALVFWMSSARIMWCFFYQPERLPRSYNKWIMTLANIDPRILATLRALRSGDWSYRLHYSTQPDLVSSLSRDLGYPSIWGDYALLPAYGGPQADEAWKLMGVTTRKGLGGIPCELVHGSVTGGSCTANAVIRGVQAFAEALALYTPVHFLPIILTRPQTLLHLPKFASTVLSLLRSASFLSAFVSSIWLSVCLTRTLVLARLFPAVSHDFWDGPLGCTFVGSLVCGASIWIEQGRRRGEIALYVLPRAIRACLPEKWLKGGSTTFRYAEWLAFVLSLSTLLSAAIHQPDSLRGLSRWILTFVMKWPKTGLRKRELQENSRPDAPVEPPPMHRATP